MDKVIKMYCSNEMAALRVLAESQIILCASEFDDVDEYDELYEKIKRVARDRSRNFVTYDERYKENLRRAKYCREHGITFMDRIIWDGCIIIKRPRLRRVRRA